LVPDTSLTVPNRQCLISNVDLRIEGIEFFWMTGDTAVPVTITEALVSHACIRSLKGRLKMRHCRVVTDVGSTAIASTGSDVTIENCHLMKGVCIAWKPSPSTVTISNCVLEGKFGFFSILAATKPAVVGNVRIVENTFSVERGMQFFHDGKNRKTMLLTVKGNAFDCVTTVSCSTLGGFIRGGFPSMMEAAKETFLWVDEANVYKRSSANLSGNRPKNPISFYPSELKTLDAWLELWSNAKPTSIEGEFRFGDRKDLTETLPLEIAAIEVPSGPLPKKVGADASTVGPGKAYWKYLDDQRNKTN
jgi:hypothetical protein